MYKYHLIQYNSLQRPYSLSLSTCDAYDMSVMVLKTGLSEKTLVRVLDRALLLVKVGAILPNFDRQTAVGAFKPDSSRWI